MKDFILNLPFVKKALEEAKLRGGIEAFPLASKDILETMRDDLDKQADELSLKKLNDLLSVVDQNKIVSYDARTKQVYIGGELADQPRLLSLRAEAEYIAVSDIWTLLYETPKELAQRAMFVSGESLDDMKKGKSMLYTLDTQKKLLDTFKNYTPK